MEVHIGIKTPSFLLTTLVYSCYTGIDQVGLMKGSADILKTFWNLEPEKQKRILDAAYREFAEYGYAQASTNRIVKEAGIGKGMLFYYFNSKKELFHYLIEHAVNYVTKEYLEKLDESETDFLEKYKKAAQTKMKAYFKNPHVFNFLGSFYVNKEMKLPKDLENRVMVVRKQAYSKLFNHIDTSLFREDIATEKIIKLIQWTVDGYEKELINSLRGRNLTSIDFGPYWDDFYAYLDLLKKVYYRKGEENNERS